MATMSKYFRAVEINEQGSDEPVQYVGCYVLKWGKIDHPTMGFIPVEDDQLITAQNERLKEALRESLAYFEGEWAAVNNHPASRFGDWVDMIEQALEDGDD